ncbi:hypothetical protein E2C01_075761 [Portunus trituberculatus]|uniref:Uncharacterized protein n=1 Tax=Portunus trituberculatus TaxID=210409 RepID=A0A5B7IGL4_PORTR|nr:hypothetical protein [Portunus trituberculatus]
MRFIHASTTHHFLHDVCIEAALFSCFSPLVAQVVQGLTSSHLPHRPPPVLPSSHPSLTTRQAQRLTARLRTLITHLLIQDLKSFNTRRLQFFVQLRKYIHKASPRPSLAHPLTDQTRHNFTRKLIS